MSEKNNGVIAVLDDLMFMVKIQEAVKRAGLEGLFVKSQQEALLKAREGALLIIIDLNYAKAEPLNTISLLKTDELTRSIPLLGYVSHVQTELRQAAVSHGCDTVVARSAFVQNLPELIQKLKAV